MGPPDPHSYGSGNPGATNVLRTGNKKAAILTLIGDGLKGWFAVWLAWHFGPGYGLEDSGVALAALGVFLGHLFPVFHRFAGGKGGPRPPASCSRSIRCWAPARWPHG